ncbi:MAG: hypothetical protein KDK36_03100 [Leptospiraceae bacterium]|nr:hypothetical protein [Leptospiraceae bacterium]
MIYDEFEIEKIKKDELDIILSKGFRHFGRYFFRYQFSTFEDNIAVVLPLRINLKNFQFSKSQRKVLSKNKDLKFQFQPAIIDEEKEKLFYNHVRKFKENVPGSIFTFLSEDPANIPCETYECNVFKEDKLIASSFLDIGERSTSSIYGMFLLEESKRSLGIYTMLLEIQYSIENNMEFYYPGYAYNISSFYDYKKSFSSLEFLDWKSLEWKPYN